MQSKKGGKAVKYPQAFSNDLGEPVDAFSAAEFLDLGVIKSNRDFCCPGTDCETPLTLARGSKREPYLTAANRQHAEQCEFKDLKIAHPRRTGIGPDPRIDQNLPIDFYPTKVVRSSMPRGQGSPSQSQSTTRSNTPKPVTRAPRKYGLAALVASGYSAWCAGELDSKEVRTRTKGQTEKQLLKELFLELNGQQQEELAGQERIYCGQARIRKFRDGFRIELKGGLSYGGDQRRVSTFIDSNVLQEGDTPQGLMRKKFEKLGDSKDPLYAFVFGKTSIPNDPRFINIDYKRELSRVLLWSGKTFDVAQFLDELSSGQKFLF